MSSVQALRCRECGHTVEIGAVHVCEFCFGPLEIVYDYERMAATVSRESIASGPESIWRYAELLPELPDAQGDTDPQLRVDLGAGWTPLVRAPRLGAALGLNDLWLKNDTVNPTFAFKDRVVSVALSAARRLGFDTVACASTGNLANSVAAHAAKSGLDAYVFIPEDLEEAKVVTSAVYGQTLVAVKGNYDAVNRLCAELGAEYGWAFVNVNVRPYYAEGSKTIGFEIAEQLGWTLPDHVVAPMASGSMYVKIDKAFTELVTLGLVTEHPWRMSGAQAAGCSPIATAFNGSGHVQPVKPDTVAKSLSIGDPADAYYAMEAAHRTGGWMAAASDEEIVDGIAMLARTEGIFAETAGGTTIACLARAARNGWIDPNERTVAVISGNGLKTLDAVASSHRPQMTINASFDAFVEAEERRRVAATTKGAA